MAKWKGDTTLNHRCLYCGDSSKNTYKARGYHFAVEQSFIYKCHNCGKSTSSVNFIKDHFPVIHKEYVKEWLKESGRKPKNHASGHKMPSANTFKFTPKTEINTKDIMTVENLKFLMKPCNEVAVAKKYLEDRKIPKVHFNELWYTEHPQSLSLLSSKYKDRVLGNDPRIILPFFSEDGELIGISGRAINDSPLRYLTMRFRDDLPLIFNLNKVDRTKTIYVTEGPIDSLFLPNSIAVAGSDFKKIDETIKDSSVLIFDNEPRNKEILKKIDEVIDLGYSVCVWNDRRVDAYKDINEMILNGLTEQEVKSIIDECTTDGLSAKLKLQEYKKI
jgi:DNA-directed RNA polymerase subunit RPC12/RpoP